MSIFLTVSEGGKSVTKHWYQLQHPDRSNVKFRIWNGALRTFIELVRDIEQPDRSNVKCRIWDGALGRFVELVRDIQTCSPRATIAHLKVRKYSHWTKEK